MSKSPDSKTTQWPTIGHVTGLRQRQIQYVCEADKLKLLASRLISYSGSTQHWHIKSYNSNLTFNHSLWPHTAWKHQTRCHDSLSLDKSLPKKSLIQGFSPDLDNSNTTYSQPDKRLSKQQQNVTWESTASTPSDSLSHLVTVSWLDLRAHPII